MKPAQAGGLQYDARMRRATSLASAHPFAAEILRFYSRVAEFQRNLYAQLPRKLGHTPVPRPDGSLRSELNLVILLPHFPDWLNLIALAGPLPLASAARQLAACKSSEWVARFNDFWSLGVRPASDRSTDKDDASLLDEFLLIAFLHPYCEFLAAHQPSPVLERTYRTCPRCGSLPLLGVLRPEGDGGKRLLLCSFCLQEWDFRRIFCVNCEEDDEKKLPVYVAEQFPYIRVEACDTCKTYVRTIDLTKDGNAIPIVDDLAAIPLTLWADEHNYTRLQPNLLGA